MQENNKKTTKSRHVRKRQEHIDTAKQRIKQLFEQAEEMFSKDTKLSDRYVYLARKIAMKYKVKLTSDQRRKFCKHCYSFLMPGRNCRVRLTGKTVTYSCKNCKKFTRVGYK
jgi:ribonuclease P protein subunit RPR2